MKAKMSFNKKEKGWDGYYFYKIYMKDDVKTIKFIGTTDRECRDKEYLSWVCTYCDEECEMPLEDFLEWSAYYQLAKLFERCENIEVEKEPWECLDQANEWVKGDGNGSYYKELLKLSEFESCGYYYGI